MNSRLLFFIAVCSGMLYAADEKIIVPLNQNNERHIVVIIASYNNMLYYRQNLNSVFDQLYSNYHIIYVDDCSTDDTYEAVVTYIRNRNMEDKIVLIHNKERRGALFNQYHAIHRCKDTDLVIILDGDDYLYDNQVFRFINAVYKDPNIWLTYGQWVDSQSKAKGWCVAIPQHVVLSNGFREFTHAPGHLRTYYAGLFKQIKKEDLMYENNFFSMTGDAATMFPMIEMARKGHFLFIDKPLMVYNSINPLNDHKVSNALQQKLNSEVRSRKKYEPIETPFLSMSGGIQAVAA